MSSDNVARCTNSRLLWADTLGSLGFQVVENVAPARAVPWATASSPTKIVIRKWLAWPTACLKWRRCGLACSWRYVRNARRDSNAHLRLLLVRCGHLKAGVYLLTTDDQKAT
jgi:hypothetical protein